MQTANPFLTVLQSGSASHPLFKAACDPTSPEFGTVPLVVQQKGWLCGIIVN